MVSQILWDAAKIILSEKLTAIQAYLKNKKKQKSNNRTLHLKKLEKEQSPKLTDGNKYNIRAEINEVDQKKNQWNYPTWADLQGKCNESNGEN